MKSVIFNADDFGANPAVNAAVIRSHTDGVLTSASLMVNEPCALGDEGAVALAREAPALAVGLHVVLSAGRSALGHGVLSHLTSKDGRFRSSPALAAMAAFFSSPARREARLEVQAQFERFVETGLAFSHVDGHQHLHMQPVIWDEVVRQCEMHGVRRIRIPFEEFAPASRERTGALVVAGRRMEWVFFRALRLRCLRSLIGRGFTVADRVYGHLETGHMTAEYAAALLGRLGGATNEIYLHPGALHGQRASNADTCADVEEDALRSPIVRERVTSLGIRLQTYPGIDPGMATP